MENLAAGCGPRPGVSQVHRMLSLPRRLSRSSRARQKGAVRRPAFLCSGRRPRNASARWTQPRGVAQRSAWLGLLRCPEEIRITDNAIIPLKERVVDEFYDPLTMLFRKIRGS